MVGGGKTLVLFQPSSTSASKIHLWTLVVLMLRFPPVHVVRPTPHYHRLVYKTNSYIYKRQCIMPPYLLGAQLHIDIVHLGLVRRQLFHHIFKQCTTYSSYELVVSFEARPISCFYMQWPFILYQQSTNGKVICLRMHLKRFVKLWERKHGHQIQLAIEFTKGLVWRLIPLLG